MGLNLFQKSAVAAAAICMAAGFSTAYAGVSVPGDVQWTVNSTFTDGTTLTGNFYVDVYGYFDTTAPWSLTTQDNAGGGFTGFTYDAGSVYVSSGTNFIDLEPGYQQDLHLQFSQDLTVPSGTNTILAGSSYECQGSFSCYIPNGGVTRYIDASSTGPGALTASVPEPATWAMMMLGIFGMGAMARSTRRKALAGVTAA